MPSTALPPALGDPLPGLPESSEVCVVGLGATGVAASNLLASAGYRVRAIDGRDGARPDGLDPRVVVDRPSHDPRDASAVVLSPGVNPEWPEHREQPWMQALLADRDAGRRLVLSEVELGAATSSGAMLTVGGTDGKSTTAAMAHHLLTSLGIDAALGGNSWRPLTEIVLERPDADIVVAEVSAFQLWEPHTFRQHAGILTNIAPDHLDHYEGEADYVAAKWQAFRNTAPGGTAILYAADQRLAGGVDALRARGLRIAGFGAERPQGDWDAVAWIDGPTLVVEDERGALRADATALRLPGEHNLRNALAAWLGALAVAPDATPLRDTMAVAEALSTFRGLAHRVAWVGARDGVDFYNDSKATNVHAAVTGLRAFDRPLVAIVGGVDKGLELDALFALLAERARAVVAIGAIAERLVDEAPDGLAIERAASMADAVRRAAALARPGDAVVLSPACSSFDMYSGFEARGDDFAREVSALVAGG